MFNWSSKTEEGLSPDPHETGNTGPGITKDPTKADAGRRPTIDRHLMETMLSDTGISPCALGREAHDHKGA